MAKKTTKQIRCIAQRLHLDDGTVLVTGQTAEVSAEQAAAFVKNEWAEYV